MENMNLTFVNVGYGEAILVSCPDASAPDGVFTMLIDGGSGLPEEYQNQPSGRLPVTEFVRRSGLGHVDAMVSTEYNEYYQIQMAGIDVSEDNIIYLRDEGFDIPEDGVYTTEEYYSSHRDIVERFVGATRRGWDWVRRPENFLETVNTIVDIMREDNIPSSVTNQTYMLRTILRLQQDKDGKEVPYHLDKSRFDSAVRILLENNLILSPVEYSDFVRP